jgi:hypothetical protein
MHTNLEHKFSSIIRETCINRGGHTFYKCILHDSDVHLLYVDTNVLTATVGLLAWTHKLCCQKPTSRSHILRPLF